jgi:predicted nucleic acid-binding protein
MILLDTTVLVQYMRTASEAIKAVLSVEPGAICGVTRAEVLHGARSDRDASDLVAALDCLIQIPVEEEAWDDLGQNLRILRSRGLAVPFPDALIATIAIRKGPATLDL